jgi:RHS repeat-associated protein
MFRKIIALRRGIGASDSPRNLLNRPGRLSARRSRLPFLETLIKRSALVMALAFFSIMLNAQAQKAYVTDFSGSTVSVVNLSTNALTATLSVGAAPADVVITPDGLTAYVANYISGGVSIISTASDTVIGSFTLPNPPSSNTFLSAAVNAAGTSLYLADFASAQFQVVDTATDALSANIPLSAPSISAPPRSIAVASAINRIYVANGDGSLSIINSSTNTLITTTDFGGPIFGPCVGGLGTIGGITTNSDNSRVYFSCLPLGHGFQSVIALDTSSNTIAANIPVSSPQGLVISPDGTKVYVKSLHGISIIDTATNTVSGTVSTSGTAGSAIAITPDGSTVLVSSGAGGTGGTSNLSVIDTATNTVTGTVTGLGANPRAIAILAPPAASTGSLPKELGDGQVGCPKCGNPIDLASGNKYETVTDYETAGQNKLSFSRYYNSKGNIVSSFATALGVNWRSNFDRYIRINSPSSVSVERASGQQLDFTLVGSTWTSDSDVNTTLTNSGSNWTLTDTDDTVETYTNISSSEATLNSITLRNGYAQTLTYSSGLLSSVTDSYSRSLSFAYSSGLLSTVTSPDSHVYTYGYTAAGGSNVLTSVAYPTSPATNIIYIYDDTSLPFALTGITDENGDRYATWTYDTTGRGLTSKHGTGADLVTITYDNATGNRTVTNALGQSETYKFTVQQNLPKVTEIDRAATSTTAAATKTLTYDSNGYTATETDWNGDSTHYTNDAKGQPTSITEAYGTAVARTTGITYHATFHVPTQIVTDGLQTGFTYSGTGDLLTKTLTDTTTTSVPYSTSGQARTWTYTWSNHLLASVQLPRTDVTAKTQFAYNSDGSLHTTTDALSHVTTVTLHNNSGQPTQISDPNGVVQNLAYNPRLNKTSDTIFLSIGSATTGYSYDAAQQLLTTTLPDSSTFTNAYDTAHRSTKIINHATANITYTLDALGDATQATTKDYLGTIRKQHYGTYDALGRRLTDSGGVSGETTTFIYDNQGNATSITDPLSHAATRVFDALNRLHTSTDATSGVTTTGYDAHDRPLSVQTPNGATTAYVYDGFGEMIQESSPDRGTSVYHYDPDGNLTQRVDGNSAVMNQTFDAADRILTRAFPADSSLNVTYTYDQTGHGKGIGRLTTLADAAGTLSISYNERGSRTSEVRTIPGGAHTLTTGYAYDLNGLLTQIVYPSGWTVAYTRDYQLRIAAVQAKPAGGTYSYIANTIGHYPFGPNMNFAYGNGVTETPTYDLDYRLTNLWNVAGSTTIQNLAYAYDNASNVNTITDFVTSSKNQSFGYDPLDRMTSSSGAYGPISWTYDHNGNRTQQTASSLVTGYTLVSNSNRIASITNGGSTQSASYDTAGNLTVMPSSLLTANATYNAAGQMATMSGASAATYIYDAFGQRISKTHMGSTNYYTYGQSGETLEDNGFLGSPTDYVYVDGKPIAVLQGTSVYYVHTDRLGTPQLATDASKATVWSATLRPFGTAYALSGSLIQNLRFPGQFFDAESLFQHNGARDYVPQLGRYLQSDPIGLAGGTNTYLYANANPVRFVDPLGFADLELFPNGSRGAQTALSDNAADYFTVVAHGSSQFVLDQTVAPSQFTPNYSGRLLTADELASLITSKAQGATWVPNEPIILHACNTGEGPNSFAQQLADKLHTTVFAPNSFGDLVSTVDSSGFPHYDHFEVENGGHIVTFKPRQ